MKTRHFIAMGTLSLLLAGQGEARADDRITAFVDANGKLVFTNLASHEVGNAGGRTVVEPSPVPPPTAVTATTTGTSEPSRLDGLIDSISARHGVNASLVRAVMRVESNSDRRAVSNKGALGLMQLMPATGKRFGVRDFFDPAQNIDGGVRYLRFLLEKFEGNVDLSLAAYNSGENRVARLGRIPRIPETQNYVRKVRAAYLRISSQVQLAVSPKQMTQTATQNPALRAATVSPTVRIEASDPDSSVIYRSVDQRGVARFSNVGPQR
jgi:soluble lytic murein transglycosylase-like protein